MTQLPLQNRMTFRGKLTMLVLTTTVMAIVIVATTVVVYSYFEIDRRVVKEASILARVVADNSRGAIDFENRDDAAEVLAALAADENVLAAATYADDRLFAQYPTPENGGAAPATVAGFTAKEEPGRRVFSQPIVSDDRQIGTICMLYDVRWIYASLAQTSAMVAGAMALSLLVSLLVTRRFKHGLVRPIRHLAETSRQVSREKDYGIRAIKSTQDELGELTDSFNEMLGEIQNRDAELERHKQELEDRVARRTADLETARVAAETAEEKTARYAEALEARNAALEEARRAAQLASRAKGAFLANMSHEIRSPMTAILGYAEILYREGDRDAAPPHRVEALETIMRNGRHLLNVINDILDLSKLEAGKMTIEKVRCSPALIVNDVADLMRVRAAAKGLSLDVEFAGPIPETIESDPTRLRQVLVNLAGNAIKFTETGGVRIRAMIEGGDVGARFRVDVIDTGIGIAAADMAQLFDPFTQADASTTRRFGGTGLGLTISRQFAQLLGGDIHVESRAGAGSTFTLTVDPGSLAGVPRLARPDDARSDHEHVTAPAASTARLEGRRILLAEDTPDNQRLITYHLKKASAFVDVAADGRVAVEKALDALRAGTPYDCILMDMQMPELDGYAATTLLRDQGYHHPIVALTANAMRGDRERCLAAGMDDYVAKPIQAGELFEAIRRAVDGTGGPARPGTDEPPPWSRSVLDRPALRTRFRDDPAVLAELINLFLEESPKQLDALRIAVARGDLAAVGAATHILKGTVGNFAAPAALNAVRRLEMLAAGGDAAGLEAAVEEVGNELERLGPELRREVESH